MTSTGTLKDCEENIRKNEELRELILNSSHLTSAQPVSPGENMHCRLPVVLERGFPPVACFSRSSCVCVYVCMYVCVYKYIYVCVHVYVWGDFT